MPAVERRQGRPAPRLTPEEPEEAPPRSPAPRRILALALLIAVAAPFPATASEAPARAPRAAAIVPAPTGLPDEARRLVAQAEADRLAGNVGRARAALEAAVAITRQGVQSGAPDARAAHDHTRTALGVLLATEGLEEGKARLAAVLGGAVLVGGTPPAGPGATLALATLAGLVAEDEDDPDARERGRAYALRAADAADDPLLRAHALTVAARLADIPAEAGEDLELAAASLGRAAPGPALAGSHAPLVEAALAAAGPASGPDAARLRRLAERGIARLEAAARAPGPAGSGDAGRLAAEAAAARAELARQRADTSAALEHSARALALGSSLGSARLLFRVARLRGRIAEEAGRPDIAAGAYAVAFDNLRVFRDGMVFGFDFQGRSVYRRAAAGFHDDYVRFLLARGGAPDLQTAVEVLDDLKIVDVEEYFRARCARRERSAASVLTDRGGLLDDRTAVLYPAVLDDRLELFVIRLGRIDRVTNRRTGRAALARLAAAARRAAEDPAIPHPAPASVALHDAVFAPVRPLLEGAGIERILYVPDGPLRLVPLAALSDGARWVLEDYEVATGLGVTFALAPEPFRASASSAFVAGATTTPGREADRLAAVPRETEDIAALFRAYARAGDRRIDAGLPAAGLERALRAKPYTVIHVSAHAEFARTADPATPTDRGGSYIGLADGRVPVADFVRALQGRQAAYGRGIDLLVLSACQTAAGSDRAPLGIAGAAYRARVATVVATLWSVYDVSADRIARRFHYNLLVEGMARGRALTEAQRWFLRRFAGGGEGRDFGHPAYWSPFVLVGDWR